jgi:membrane fusion protein (multidrug efflux system)
MSHSFPPILSAVAVALASALLVACGEAPRPPVTGAQGVPQVSVLTVQAQRLALTTELPGRISPVQIAEVRPQVSGLVKTRRFKEGSDVKAGELLYQIDPALYRASVDNAQATLAKAQASLVTVKLKAERYKELGAIKAVSQQDADDAAASLLQAEAEVIAARSALQTQRINLDYTRIVSPVSGRIGRSAVTPGALVTANQASAMATVQQLDPIYVDVSQSSSALLALRRSLGRRPEKRHDARQADAGGRQQLRARRQAAVLRSDRGPEHRWGDAARRVSQPEG